MKKIFTLIASMVLTLSIFAADRAPFSKVTIKSMDKSDIRVIMDGKLFDGSTSNIMIQGVDAGTHTVKVLRERSNGIFNLLGKKFDVIYNSTINVKKRTHLTITISRYGTVDMQETRIRRNDGRVEDRAFDYDRDGKWGNYDTNYGYETSMRNSEFQRVLQSIDKEWLESNKLKSATQVVKSNRMSVSQVRQLVQLFGFENNKLELAKQAYANTVDKENYDEIFEVFTFSSNKAELQRYIRNFR